MTNAGLAKTISDRTKLDYVKVLHDVDVSRPDETDEVDVENWVSGFMEAYESAKEEDK